MKIPIEVTARHIHIKKEHLKILFGEDYSLTKLKELSLPGQFACKETLTIKLNEASIENVRIVGPERDYTQVELSLTDAYNLGLKPPVRLSSDLSETPGITLIGPRGELVLTEGVILPHRHIHTSPKEATRLGLRNQQMAAVEIESGFKSLIFKNVAVRENKNFKLFMHIDTDEGNAAGINKVGFGKIVKYK